MTLRRKMALQIMAMIVGLLLISGASLWGLNGLREDYVAAVGGYQDLRQIYEVGSSLAVAREFLTAEKPDVKRAIEHVQRALTRLEGTDPWRATEDGTRASIRAGLRDGVAELQVWDNVGGEISSSSLNKVLGEIGIAGSRVGEQIQASQDAAERKRRTTVVALGILCAGVVLAAILLGLWQYRSVMNPLNRLGGAVRRVARGQFGVRILESGMPSGADNEFARLASDFNRMAEELDSFYRELEKKVAAKSKELIRSERLASVGYLAAGVAHEINNPLAIISGYAEIALAEMKNGRTAALDGIDGTLRVIRDEAFRCKDITDKLLSLARPGDSQRHPVNLATTAEQVVSMLAGLRDFKDRTIGVRAESREPLVVDAVEGEMKQVLMNLLLNALEATDPGTGEVRVTVSRGDDDPTVTLAVADNGRGMSSETLEHVFEPFFTDRRPRDLDTPARPGTGLGLSITHAIIQAHGGRLTAQSDGVGFGSRFIIELPAAAIVEV